MATVTFRDETTIGRRLDEISVPDLPERRTVRELIRLRVGAEVARDRQVEHLDEIVELTSDTEVVFIRLVPPAGG